VRIAFLLALCLTSLTALAADSNQLSTEEKKDGFTLLFDGKSLDQWRGYKKQEPHKGWQAVDGTIARVGSGGDLITKKKFRSFDFRFDWKISPKGNSGVMYMVNENNKAPYFSGPEYQVFDNGKLGPVSKTSSGSNYALHPPSKDVVKPVGEWNTARIVIDGKRVEHWLNGEMVVTYNIRTPEWEAMVAKTKFKKWPDYGRSEEGHLCLQDHGNAVWYRNLRIKELPEKK
jgi:hypothetical protein